jgi:hypothetical protein
MKMIGNIRFEIEKTRDKLKTFFSAVEQKKKRVEKRKEYQKDHRKRWNDKNKRVYFYVTPKEQKALLKRAKKHKVSVSNYINQILFSDENKHQINTVFDTKKHQNNLVEVLKELARIGNNINQMTKQVNRQSLAGKSIRWSDKSAKYLQEIFAYIKQIQKCYFE